MAEPDTDLGRLQRDLERIIDPRQDDPGIQRRSLRFPEHAKWSDYRRGGKRLYATWFVLMAVLVIAVIALGLFGARQE